MEYQEQVLDPVSGEVLPEGSVPPVEHHTRHAVARLLLTHGPVTAGDVAAQLGVSAAGVRRHLDAMLAAREVTSTITRIRGPRGRGRPARQWLLTATGRSRFGHAYDDLATAALRHLREVGGESAIAEFARRRVATIVAGVPAEQASTADRAGVADLLADALSTAGYAASTRQVGSGVQLCQHHCPVAHVAAEFPQLCEAERHAFADLLGTHVQRLATIANGDPVCTTHIPLTHRPARPALRKEFA